MLTPDRWPSKAAQNGSLLNIPGHRQVVRYRLTLKILDDTKHARIVIQIVGPVSRLHVRHVPSDWVLFTIGHSPDLVADIEKVRQCAERNGYTVEPGYKIEDRNPRIDGALKAPCLDAK
jgi:hypothetical protein